MRGINPYTRLSLAEREEVRRKLEVGSRTRSVPRNTSTAS